MIEYYVPAGLGAAEYIEKRSRFIGHVWRVESEAEARDRISDMKSDYYDARHNCWCCIVCAGAVLRYSDDGEPQGTAGQPMLEVFKRNNIENVCCVVTRYFGGVLLGAGGLARAYTHTAKLALDAAGISVMRMWKCIYMECPYNLFERVKNTVALFDGIVESVEYGTSVDVTALLPEEKADEFVDRLTDISAGTINGVITGEIFRAVPLK